MINGGLGLHLARNSMKGEIAYGVVAGIVGVTYLACAIYGEIKRSRNQAAPPYDKAGVRHPSPNSEHGGGFEHSPNRNGEYYAKPEEQPRRYT